LRGSIEKMPQAIVNASIPIPGRYRPQGVPEDGESTSLFEELTALSGHLEYEFADYTLRPDIRFVRLPAALRPLNSTNTIINPWMVDYLLAHREVRRMDMMHVAAIVYYPDYGRAAGASDNDIDEFAATEN